MFSNLANLTSHPLLLPVELQERKEISVYFLDQRFFFSWLQHENGFGTDLLALFQLWLGFDIFEASFLRLVLLIWSFQAEMALKQMKQFENVSPPLLKQVMPLLEQLPPLYEDLADGKDQFMPAPEETDRLVSLFNLWLS